MNKLDDNYLQLVRSALYNTQNTKRKRISAEPEISTKSTDQGGHSKNTNIPKPHVKIEKTTFKEKSLKNIKKKVQPKQVSFNEKLSIIEGSILGSPKNKKNVKRNTSASKSSKKCVKLSNNIRSKNTLQSFNVFVENSEEFNVSEYKSDLETSPLKLKNEYTKFPVHKNQLLATDKVKKKKPASSSSESNSKHKKGNVENSEEFNLSENESDLEIFSSKLKNDECTKFAIHKDKLLGTKRKIPPSSSSERNPKHKKGNILQDKSKEHQVFEDTDNSTKEKSHSLETQKSNIKTLKKSKTLNSVLTWNNEAVGSIMPDTTLENEKHKTLKLKVMEKKLKKNKNKPEKEVDITLFDDLDEFDNKFVGVRGFRFQKFCTLFPSMQSELYLGQTSNLCIPEKHFVITDEDSELQLLTEKTSSEEIINNNVKKLSPEINKKINILDIKIIPCSADENNQSKKEIISQRDSVSFTEDLQINLDTSVNQEHALEEVEGNSNENSVLENSIENMQSISEENNNVDVIKLKNEDILVILDPGVQTHFFGLCTLEVLYGKIQIFGSTLTKQSGRKKVYSPRGSSLLNIKNGFNLFVENTIALSSCVAEDILPKNYSDKVCNQNCSIFICMKLKEPFLDFIESHIPQKIFPEVSMSNARVDFNLKGVWNKILITESWEEVLRKMLVKQKIIIAGGKGVGKSTFLRYSVNKLLEKFERLRVIDLDSGQSEFTAPGCISVVTVENQLFGPNYTHLQKPECAVLSHINIGNDIEKYLDNVRYLIQYVELLDCLPTIVNFPGFTQGFGLDISLNSISYIKPDLIVYITSRQVSKNYKFDLTAENVQKYIAEKHVLCQNRSDKRIDLKYEHVTLESLSENNESWSLEARQWREINILSYFGKMMTENVKHLTNININMYCINLSSLNIASAEGQPISPLVINANLVALCSVKDQECGIFISYGYGFVRGIDIQADVLVLLTPEPIEILNNVSHLVLGSVTTPPSLLMTTDNVEGPIPYVSATELTDFGQFTKRSYIPARK